MNTLFLQGVNIPDSKYKHPFFTRGQSRLRPRQVMLRIIYISTFGKESILRIKDAVRSDYTHGNKLLSIAVVERTLLAISKTLAPAYRAISAGRFDRYLWWEMATLFIRKARPPISPKFRKLTDFRSSSWIQDSFLAKNGILV